MQPLFFKAKRISSFVFIETLLCISISLILFSSVFAWILVEANQKNKYRSQQSSRNNVNFLLSSIQEDLLYAKWGSKDFSPANLQTSSSLGFKTFDGTSLIRFYQSGQEVGRDINMTTYNAITDKTIRTFSIKRQDLLYYYLIIVKITDIYGNNAKKTFTSKKRL